MLRDMCTVALRVTPGRGLLLLGIRDEFLGREWRPPAAHWPGSPLVGGIDEQAGGTWLAVHPAELRVACVLNGRGQLAPAATRRSRGDLPLRAAAGELVSSFSAYDPFHLVCADTSGAWVLSWDGTRSARVALGAGTHLFTNAGYVYPGDSPDEKGAYFGPRFAAAGWRAEAGAAAGWPAEAGGRAVAAGGWSELARGDGLATDDPRAIIVRRELPDGRVWGTSSISLVAIDGADLSYEFGTPSAALEPVISSSSTGASRRSSSR
jgi:hypothetical protein